MLLGCDAAFGFHVIATKQPGGLPGLQRGL
jgi:hypothetical protein